MFEWLTGSQGESDYSFDELEQGGASFAPTPARGNKHVPISRNPEPSALQEIEEEPSGELAVDVYQTSTEVVIKTMVSGVKPEDLEIAITREMVTIKGRRELGREVSNDDYFQQELYWGAFSRTILLPVEIDVEESEAMEKHGLLTVRLPKIDMKKTQSLKVKSI